MSTLKTTNLQHASAGSPAIVLASDGTATAQLSSVNGGPLAGTRNRIINGDMRIDQRNAGASVTPTSDLTYVVDRWLCGLTQSSKFSVQQNAGSVTPPVGFSTYLGITSLSAYSVLTGDSFRISQRIEGFNFSDLAWGTASASTATISFWVRSSLSGTFGGSLTNSAQDYSYPFTFSISTTNTWEYKTITVAGPTAGTWIGGTNGIGVIVNFNLGAGSTFSGTAGAWSAGTYLSATGATSVVGTNGATFYITGVQLEPGSVATPFERRSYGQELSLCQRYYEQVNAWWVSDVQNTSTYGTAFVFAVEKRATPTMASISQGGAANGSMNTRTPSAFSSRKGGATTATASTTIVSAGFNDVYSASAEL
jgi:hypothetical protein